MKLLFLTQTYPRFEGDTAGPFIRDLARGLVAGGDQVTILAPHAPGVRRRWVDAGVEVLTFRYAPQRMEVLGYGRSLSSDETVKWRAGGVTPLYALAASLALRRLSQQQSFDLVHAHWIVPNGLIAAACRQPLAVGLHGSDVFLAERWGVRSLVAKLLRRTSLLTGCSPELVERVCNLGFAVRQARVIPYGVDTAQFSPDPARGALWRARLQLPPSAKLVLAVGRMVSKKGFHVLLSAAPELFRRSTDLHLVVAGAGDRLEEFKRWGSTWPGRVHFPGSVLRDTLPDLYRAADVFVMPAIHDDRGNVDGLPNVVLEAMASGLPVVASGISGIPLAVTDAREGFLIPERDTGALIEALMRLLGSRDARVSMGRAARRKAETALSWPAIANRYRQAYEETLARLEASPARADAVQA